MAKFKKIFFQIVRILICAALLIAVVSLFINQHIKNQTEDDILYTATDSEGISQEEAQELINFGADCIIVLGAGITDSETPSPMLKDRLDLGIDLYKNGAAPKCFHIQKKQEFLKKTFSATMQDFLLMTQCTERRAFSE